jgi:hypothetical protein
MRVIGILLVLLSTPVCADIYKSINADGEVVYSDKPEKGAEQLEMQPLPSYTPPPQNTAISLPAQSAVQPPPQYRSFALVSPVHEATIRNNLGTIEVTASLEPALLTREGHRIQYFLDGIAQGDATDSSTLTLTNIDRGEHQLSASVVDAQGGILMETPLTTVFVKRTSKLHGERQGSVTDNPGYMTDNPNITGDKTFQPYTLKDIADFSGNKQELDPDEAEQPVNPGFRNRNPNILSPNPNIRTSNPYLVNPPLPNEE